MNFLHKFNFDFCVIGWFRLSIGDTLSFPIKKPAIRDQYFILFFGANERKFIAKKQADPLWDQSFIFLPLQQPTFNPVCSLLP
jgi:hypothetical protein